MKKRKRKSHKPKVFRLCGFLATGIEKTPNGLREARDRLARANKKILQKMMEHHEKA